MIENEISLVPILILYNKLIPWLREPAVPFLRSEPYRLLSQKKSFR